MKVLLFAILIVLPGLANNAQSQCRGKQFETPHCPQIQCAQVQHHSVGCSIPTATHGQPNCSHVSTQMPTHYWTSPASVCSAAGGQPSHTVVAATEGVACTQGHIVYGHGSDVILFGSIPASASLTASAGDPIVTNGYLPGTIVHAAPISNQVTTLGNCNCGAVPYAVASASQALPGQVGAVAPRGPFSLSGQVRADTGKVVPNLCELEFLYCCSSGGKNCMNTYIACSDITGEPIRRTICPVVAPTIDH